MVYMGAKRDRRMDRAFAIFNNANLLVGVECSRVIWRDCLWIVDDERGKSTLVVDDRCDN